MNRTTTLILVLLTSFCLNGKSEGNSAKALGMGNSTVAYPQDSLVSAYNPALALSVGDRADAWVSSNFSPYDASILRSDADIHAAGRRTWTLGGAAGATRQICPELAIGFVGYNRFFHKTHYNKAIKLIGKTKLARSYELYCVSGLAAFCLHEHQFGISLDFLIGRHKVSGLERLDHHRFTEHKHRMTNRGYDGNFGLGVTLGWLWNVSPDFKVGVSFRPETKMSRFHRYKGFIPEHGVFHNPQNAIAGFSWRLLPTTTWAFDIEYIWLRRIRADKNPFSHVLKNRFGTKHGPALGLRNDLIIHTGLDYAYCPELILRAGYMYQSEVQKKCQAFWDILYCSPIQHFLTLGATYNWNDQLEFDFFYEHGFERSIENRKAVPHFLGHGKVRMRRSLDRFGVGVGVLF